MIFLNLDNKGNEKRKKVPGTHTNNHGLNNCPYTLSRVETATFSFLIVLRFQSHYIQSKTRDQNEMSTGSGVE